MAIVCEIDVKVALDIVIRGKGHTKEALLASCLADDARDVEEGCGEYGPVAQDADETGSLNDEDPLTAIVGVRDMDRLVEASLDAADRGVRGLFDFFPSPIEMYEEMNRVDEIEVRLNEEIKIPVVAPIVSGKKKSVWASI